jgi:hypothetical protein
MKGAILLLCAIFFISCDNEEVENENSVSISEESVLDGNLLKFKDDKSFIMEYNLLSGMKDKKEIQSWVAKKGFKSLLNVLHEEQEDDLVSDEQIIYSESLKAVLNSDSKFKIGNVTLWLNQRNFYILPEEYLGKRSEELVSLKKNLEIYGEVLGYSSEKNTASRNSLTSREAPIPNENGTKTFYVDLPNRKRFVLDLYNQTIVLHSGSISSSTMWLRGTLQYRSCSFWRCRWKTDTATWWKFSNVNLISTVGDYNNYPWKFSVIDTNLNRRDENYTLLATYGYLPPVDRNTRINFQVNGTVTFEYESILYPIDLSWY